MLTQNQAVSAGAIISNYTGEIIHDDDFEADDFYGMTILGDKLILSQVPKTAKIQSYTASALRKGK
jgi:hypothetical protein